MAKRGDLRTYPKELTEIQKLFYRELCRLQGNGDPKGDFRLIDGLCLLSKEQQLRLLHVALTTTVFDTSCFWNALREEFSENNKICGEFSKRFRSPPDESLRAVDLPDRLQVSTALRSACDTADGILQGCSHQPKRNQPILISLSALAQTLSPSPRSPSTSPTRDRRSPPSGSSKP